MRINVELRPKLTSKFELRQMTESFVDIGNLRLWTIVYGRQDIRPSWPVEQLAQLLPNARLEFLENAHHQIWLEHEELLQGFLREFVKKFAHST